MDAADRLASLLHQLSALFARESDQILQERIGIGLSQFKVLAALEAGPKLQQRRIALELGQTEASISRQIKLLQRGGLITVRRNPQNRREHLAELTVRGLSVAQAGREALHTYHWTRTSRLAPRQQEILLDLLRTLQR